MHEQSLHPSLDLPAIPVGPLATPYSLKRLLFKGGASLGRKVVNEAIAEGLLGSILLDRVDLVVSLHEQIEGKLAGGGSKVSAANSVKEVTYFFKWAEENSAPLSLMDLQSTYLIWAEHLYRRVTVIKNLAQRTAYSSATRVGDVIDGVLERQKPIATLTRLSRPATGKSPQGAVAEKQILHETFAFGRLLQEICDGLALRVIWGPRHVEIPLQGGGVLVPFTGGSKRRSDKVWAAWQVRNSEERARAYENDRSLEDRGRKSLVNMRIQAELLMFIGQTSMNLAQAFQLELKRFNYSSDVDGYKVREYKPRRGGEVLFVIFHEYRSHFERYLEWRRSLFPKSSLVFPVIRDNSLEETAPKFDLIISACKQVSVTWCPPSMLRGTRVNWLLRRSGDPDLTSDMAQHQKQTLLQVYEDPSVHRAVGEVGRFWQSTDPTLASGNPLRSVAPGACDGRPLAVEEKPSTAPSPDCVRPSGCLWCEHHRDIDSLDYVWAAACFRHLKILEVGRHVSPTEAAERFHPAQHAIDKLSSTLLWFRDSNSVRREWVEEALALVEEGRYHDEWSLLIQNMEGTSS
ncbi:MAG: site-specific integrase [Alcaligenaceae bacterium]|nr:MAG: site-specific integrase [Alcaligenaceae bacterium]